MNIDKDIGNNPTPQQVRDYYDLHTGEGAANFSNEDAGITVQLWHSLAWALEDNAKLEAKNEALMKLAGTYIKAYEEIAFADTLKEGDEK